MPRLPRTSAVRIITVLKALGFIMVRQKGSHMLFRKNNRGCTVPNHKEVAVGTLAGILRQADITVEEFMDEFNS